jgi:hypothetical protein
MSKTITVSVRLNVALEVIAEKDDNGDVQISSVLNFLGIPSVTEIYESMDEDDFEALHDAYDNG